MVFVGLGRFLRRSLNSNFSTVYLQYWDVTANYMLAHFFFFFFAVAVSSATLAGNQPTFGGSFVWNPLGCWNTGEKVLHHRRAQTRGQEKVILVFFCLFFSFTLVQRDTASRYEWENFFIALFRCFELLGRNRSLLHETFLLPRSSGTCRRIFLTSFGLFAMLSTPKKSLRVR